MGILILILAILKNLGTNLTPENALIQFCQLAVFPFSFLPREHCCSLEERLLFVPKFGIPKKRKRFRNIWDSIRYLFLPREIMVLFFFVLVGGAILDHLLGDLANPLRRILQKRLGGQCKGKWIDPERVVISTHFFRLELP